MPIEQIELDPRNARAHPKRSVRAVRNSIEQFGQRKPIVVQRREDGSHRVVAGNATLQACVALGWREIAAVFVEEDDSTAEAYGIADNRTAELSTWDREQLGTIIGDLKTEDWDIERLGFTDRELETMFGAGEGEDESLLPEKPDNPVTRVGDLWYLGRHRLLCGNSGSVEAVDQLMGGQEVHLVNTDPPYNVAVTPRSNMAIAAGASSYPTAGDARRGEKRQLRPRDRVIDNDSMPEAEFREMLEGWFRSATRHLVEGGPLYVWGGYANIAVYPPAMATTDIHFAQCIVWHKEHPVMTRKDFMGDFELAFYGWKKGAKHRWYGGHSIPDVWTVKKVSTTDRVHLTEKPVELARRAISYSSNRGENVLDLFGGSGSTMIAAEELGRNAFLMELDQLYADVIVMRYERFTKEPARLGGPKGPTFASVKKRRAKKGPE